MPLSTPRTAPCLGGGGVDGAIHHIANVHKYAREEDRRERTLFVITTDGMENASLRYGSDEAKAMVKKKKEKYGWELLFLGATIDLYGLMRDDAMKRIDRALRDAGPYTYQLRLVHGFHRGNEPAKHDPGRIQVSLQGSAHHAR